MADRLIEEIRVDLPRSIAAMRTALDLTAYMPSNDPAPVPCGVNIITVINGESSPGTPYPEPIYMCIGSITFRLKEFIKTSTICSFAYSAIYTPQATPTRGPYNSLARTSTVDEASIMHQSFLAALGGRSDIRYGGPQQLVSFLAYTQCLLTPQFNSIIYKLRGESMPWPYV